MSKDKTGHAQEDRQDICKERQDMSKDRTPEQRHSNTLHTITSFWSLFGLQCDSLLFWLWLTRLLVLLWLLRSRRGCLSIVSTDLGQPTCRGLVHLWIVKLI